MSRRRVLVVCYYFPPVASVGSVRVGGLAKFLPRFGWCPIVVTPRHPERRPMVSRVIETDDSDLAVRLKPRLGLRSDLALGDQVGSGPGDHPLGQRLRRGLIEIGKLAVAFPDSNRGWVRHALDACPAALADGPIEAVLTSSPPVSTHLAGRRIKRRYGLPWLADLRDLWSDDHNSTAPAYRRALERRLELRTLGEADGLVTVSEPLASVLASRHPSQRVHTILNGFDPELVTGKVPLTERFTLTHTGTFYQGRRDPSLLFEALRSLIERGELDRSRVRVRLFSKSEPWLAQRVARFGLGDVVELRGWIGWEQALAEQRRSQVLLLFHWGGERERGVYTGKIFEYLAAQRPILVVGGGAGVLADLLAETGAGVQVTDGPALEARIRGLWREFVEHGAVRWAGDEASLVRYSHLRMAREFADALDSIA